MSQEGAINDPQSPFWRRVGLPSLGNLLVSAEVNKTTLSDQIGLPGGLAQASRYSFVPSCPASFTGPA